MELVKQVKRKEKKPKLRETRFGMFAFICALLTLAYLNIFLTGRDGNAFLGFLSSIFLQALPILGVLSALLSLMRINYKKTFTWWALGLYLFVLICIVVIFFFEFAIYTKP